MGIALVLGGGAPNLTLMAGAVAALDKAGVEFDVVSTAGAGMLIGLLYAAPKNMTRAQALENTVNMGVHDKIYDLFPVNYKVFHKPGSMAQAYTSFWQTALPSYQSMWRELWHAFPGARPTDDAQRLFNDWTALMLAAFCPSALGPFSPGLCQPAPFVGEVVDFPELKKFKGEFYLSAYCIETRRMEIFPKDEINCEHFQAALAFPFIYEPFKLGGKTYLEGAAMDSLNFKGLYEHRKEERGKSEKPSPIETIVVCDVLGMARLIDMPRNLYDAWVKSIIVPLVEIAKDDIKIFREVHKPRIPEMYHQPEPKLLTIDFEKYMPEEHWPKVLDWSYSNLKTLYDVGYDAGQAFYAKHAKRLGPRPTGPAAVGPLADTDLALKPAPAGATSLARPRARAAASRKRNGLRPS